MDNTLVIRTPEDAVAAVPYLLGFHPEDSLVAVGSDGPNGTCAMRADLLPHRAVEAAERVAGLLADNGFRQALLIGYGPAERVEPVLMAVWDELAERHIKVGEALRVERGRWWSYHCEDPLCCGPDGTPYDITTTAVAAQATVAGQVVLADRASLAATVAPLGGESMRLATRRAEARVFDRIHSAERLIEEGLPFVQDVIGRRDRLTDDEVALLGIYLGHIRVRDEAWVRTRPDRHLELWRDVLRRVDERYAAAPACLLAYTAFVSGDGGLANLALDRADAAMPGYSMAELLRDLIVSGIPPRQAVLKMSPEDLAEAWDAEHPRRLPKAG
ncbi:MAG TPA: DUF4192 domain-containing protein [Streptosporangiaceae bacterium]|nr:DUF4192 domain-containing protein [Streptosporangiaceae bacterium]